VGSSVKARGREDRDCARLSIELNPAFIDGDSCQDVVLRTTVNAKGLKSVLHGRNDLIVLLVIRLDRMQHVSY